MENLKKYRVMLASASPRRRELLGMLDIDFTLAPPREIDEVYHDSLAASEVAPYLSRLKAEAYRTDMPADALVITADTVVVCDGEIMGKPHSEAEAARMLRRLSGNTHQVVTGVSVSTADRTETFSAVTQVEFADLTDEEIDYYVSRYRPMDKAGAYGIQEWIGCIGVKRIDGSFYNVMGLPLHRLYSVLKTL